LRLGGGFLLVLASEAVSSARFIVLVRNRGIVESEASQTLDFRLIILSWHLVEHAINFFPSFLETLVVVSHSE
jgi:hypothetical protein